MNTRPSTMAGDILIHNVDWIVTVDAERRVIADGSILVRDGKIAWVGSSAQTPSAPDAQLIDGRGLLATPGLIDTSVSVIQQLGRGAGDLCDIADYRLQRIAAYEAALTPQDASAAAEACMVEMVRAGTTCFLDTGSRFPFEIATAAKKVGLRGFASRACQDLYMTPMGAYPAGVSQETIAEIVDGIGSAARQICELDGDRVQPAIAVPWLLACSDALGQAIAQVMKDQDLLLVVAAAANRDEAVVSRVNLKSTELARLESMGLLGARTILSHAGWTGPDDLARIVRTGTHVSCCPSASHRMGTGALENGRFPELLSFGANLTLGSGSAMGSNFVDVARQLYLFAGGNKTFRLDATVVSPETVIEMATLRAAEALSLQAEIGSLESGKQADITLFRCLAADWVPVINPLNNLIYSARGGADTVLVGGRLLLQAGSFVPDDEEMILARCQERADALMESSGLRRFCAPAWPVI